jgi:adenylosuccinate synthase
MSSKVAKAVIGAGYGDEGKGLMTDYHAALGASVVIRSNGGAQAGHTVTTPSGIRHVFHHFGSGALADVPTHLSRFFVVNPIVFNEELVALVGTRRTTVSPKAVVTTPYDMMINQIIEIQRGHGRHGSCGLGIGETEERSLHPEYRLQVSQLLLPTETRRVLLRSIRDEWVPRRLQKLGVTDIPAGFQDVLRGDDVIERFFVDCAFFMGYTRVLEDRDLTGDLLFEGAQGLLLDQDYGAFPYVTRSNTGLKNMVAIARETGIDEIAVTYATRSYVTRHGAGPFAHEDVDMSWLEMIDLTNQPNEWQGTIRKAPLDIDILIAAVRHDISLAQGIKIAPVISMSCLDQIKDKATVVVQGEILKLDRDDIPALVEKHSGLKVAYRSYGPTRDDIRKEISA